MSRPIRQARSRKQIQRELIRDAVAFIWLLALIVIALPILAPAAVTP